MVGALQWAVSLGRLDITTVVMSMSSFRVEPREGHMERLKRTYGYSLRFKCAAIRIRPNEPDISDIPEKVHDWEGSVHGKVSEVLPTDTPEPLGKFVVTISYHDANLYHNVLTGRSVTGIPHLVNKTPIDWYSKKQPTVETAACGSEFSSARTCAEQIIDLRNTLRYLCVLFRKKSFMFGDNDVVVNESVTPRARIHKRHAALLFRRVREAIAVKIVSCDFIRGVANPADILSKYCGHSKIWPTLKPLLFWQGDAMDCFEDEEQGCIRWGE